MKENFRIINHSFFYACEVEVDTLDFRYLPPGKYQLEVKDKDGDLKKQATLKLEQSRTSASSKFKTIFK